MNAEHQYEEECQELEDEEEQLVDIHPTDETDPRRSCVI